MTDTNLYETDFVAWTERQATLLRTPVTERCSLALDWENLAEEIETLGRTYRRSLANHVRNVIEYLLKLQYAPANTSRAAWIAALDRERSQIEAGLEDEPGRRRGGGGPCEDAPAFHRGACHHRLVPAHPLRPARSRMACLRVRSTSRDRPAGHEERP